MIMRNFKPPATFALDNDQVLMCIMFRFFPVEIYLSPVETHCSNIDYFPKEEKSQTQPPSDDSATRFHLSRSVIALFVLR
jgi:hypothetical protein